MSTLAYAALIGAVLALCFSCSLLLKGIYYGRRARTYSTIGYSSRGVTVLHKKYMDRFLLSLLLPVGCIEALVWQEGGRWGGLILFLIHMTLVAIFVVGAFCSRFLFTGVNAPGVHRVLVKVTIVAFTGVMVTGAALFYQLLEKHDVPHQVRSFFVR